MFVERWLWQIFGENIGGLVSSLDIRHGDDTFAMLFTHIMLTQLDMVKQSRHAYLLVISSLSKYLVYLA